MNKDILFEEFQNAVNEALNRNRSFLDILTKIQGSSARVNRTCVKSVTSCGCLQVKAERQHIPEDTSLDDMGQYMNSHLEGALCDDCREMIEKELGNHFFYIAALANLLDISLYDILLKEEKNLSALGKYVLK